MSDVCGFCRGKPVLNAEAWTSLDAPKYAPCPRCGHEWHADALAEYELADEQAMRDEHAGYCVECGVQLNENEAVRCSICYARTAEPML